MKEVKALILVALGLLIVNLGLSVAERLERCAPSAERRIAVAFEWLGTPASGEAD